MTVSTESTRWTDEDFMAPSKDGHRYELVNGEPIVEYFENDTRLIWAIHPDEKYVLVYHSSEPDRLL